MCVNDCAIYIFACDVDSRCSATNHIEWQLRERSDSNIHFVSKYLELLEYISYQHLTWYKSQKDTCLKSKKGVFGPAFLLQQYWVSSKFGSKEWCLGSVPTASRPNVSLYLTDDYITNTQKL